MFEDIHPTEVNVMSNDSNAMEILTTDFVLPISIEHVFDILQKSHRHILYTFPIEFWFKKFPVWFVIYENSNPYLTLRETYLKNGVFWLAGQSVPICIKEETCTLIQTKKMF